MMQGRFFDGRSSRPHDVVVRDAGGALRFEADGHIHEWPLDGLDAEIVNGQARVRHASDRDARLVLAEADWRLLGGPDLRRALDRSQGRARKGERRLIIGLVSAAAAVAAFVFIGMPILSGPLARATPPDYERRMGHNFDLQMAYVFPDCTGLDGQRIIADLGDRIARGADTEFDIAVRLVHAPMVNAFALPGGPILLTDDLIREAQSPDEVAAVVAHEIAHVEKRHVMQAVWRSLGMGLVLDAVVGGGTGAGQQAVLLAGQATDLRYGRDAEREADAQGMTLLHRAGLSSEGMAPFFERLNRIEGNAGEARSVTEFLSTHPDTRRRAGEARERQRPGAAALSDADWAVVREACELPADQQIRRRVLGVVVAGDDASSDQIDQAGQD